MTETKQMRNIEKHTVQSCYSHRRPRRRQVLPQAFRTAPQPQRRRQHREDRRGAAHAHAVDQHGLHRRQVVLEGGPPHISKLFLSVHCCHRVAVRDHRGLPHLHLLHDAFDTGRLAGARSPGDVEAAGLLLQQRLVQEAADGRLLGVPGQEALGDGGVERLLHAVEPRFWGEGREQDESGDVR